MKLKVAKKGKDAIQMTIDGITPSFANSLRRIMIAEVPTLAIEHVDITKNNSALFDEVLAHRLGMIPLVFDPKKFNAPGECSCRGKGCPSCQVVFAVEKSTPGMVTSGDLKSSNKAVKPTDTGFPVVELLDNQQLKLEAIAQLGRGADHIKWQAAIASYGYEDDAKGNPKTFTFTVESTSGLPPEEIVAQAVEILEGKAAEFKKEAAKL